MSAPKKRIVSSLVSPNRAASARQSPEAGACNCTALRKATRRASQLYDAVLAPSGLRSTQRSILVHIARTGTPAMGELSTALVLDRSALAHNLKPLQRDGLVRIFVSKNDKRSRLVTLTDLGHAKLAESTRLWNQAQTRFETAFGPKKASALRATLETITSIEFAQAFQTTTFQTTNGSG